MSLELRETPLSSDAAKLLIGELDAETLGKYPEPGATHFRLDEDEVTTGSGIFLVAYEDGAPVAMGAIRRVDDHTVEIKRMFVRKPARGRGISKRILEALEVEARRLGATRIWLETGDRHLEAMALYRRSGFTPVEPWGEYIGCPLSVCLGKSL